MPGRVIKPQAEGYGPIRGDFEFPIHHRFTTISGKNNSGKSALLQLAFVDHVRTKNNSDICFIPQDRQYISPNTIPTIPLNVLNQNIFAQCANAPRHSSGATFDLTGLYVALLHTDSFIPQVHALNDYLIRLGFGAINLKGHQDAILDDINVSLQGSGLRCVIPILAALTSNTVGTLIIDEPELSLEARTQKELKTLLIEADKLILIATQSHLFLNREEPKANHICTLENNLISIASVENRSELLDLTYNLLGNSLEDLFFPNNFLIVEGSFEQVICEKCAELLRIPKDHVKIFSASGAENVEASLKTIERTLRPLIMNTSPYADRIVVLLDEATNRQQKKRVDDVKRIIQDRCFILDRDSIEEYLPQYLYEKCGRNKKDDMLEISSAMVEKKLRPDTGLLRLTKIKRDIATSIAEILEKRDLDNIGIIRDAVAKAAYYL
jgi:hypothetical protein